MNTSCLVEDHVRELFSKRAIILKSYNTEIFGDPLSSPSSVGSGSCWLTQSGLCSNLPHFVCSRARTSEGKKLKREPQWPVQYRHVSSYLKSGKHPRLGKVPWTAFLVRSVLPKPTSSSQQKSQRQRQILSSHWKQWIYHHKAPHMLSVANVLHKPGYSPRM